MTHGSILETLLLLVIDQMTEGSTTLSVTV